MTALFSLLLRFIAIVVGYGLACLALSAFVHALVLGGLSPDLPRDQEMLVLTSILTVPVLAALSGYHLFAPAAVLIVVAEIRGARDWLTHALGGAAAALVAAALTAARPAESLSDTGLVAVVVAAGLVGGWTYWLVAGRRSGAWRFGDLTSPGS